MHLDISSTNRETGVKAAQRGAHLIREAISTRGEAFIVLATGASQFVLLDTLIEDRGIDWSVVTVFHLDEYVGIDEKHPASFVRYLKDRFLSRVPGVRNIYFIHGKTKDTDKEIARVSEAISKVTIDVAFVGIGENSHLAFNDPPADFDTSEPFIRVELDEKCRWQQTNEGWFPSFADVPKYAISMSIRQIMKSAAIICTVTDTRKAEAAKLTLDGEVSNLQPASILQTHDNAFLFLDRDAAAQLSSRKSA